MKTKKDNRKFVYLAVVVLIVIISGIFLFFSGSSSISGNLISSNVVAPKTALKIESVEGDRVKMFNEGNTIIKTSDISFFINGSGIICSGIKELEPKKSAECTLESRCQKGDVLKITYSGKSVEYNC